MTDSRPSASPATPTVASPRSAKGLWFFGTALACALVILGLGATGDRWSESYPVRGQQADYYSMLIHGFEHHQLAMELPKDPVTHAEPAYSLDTAYYHGRHYLYYGVTPAALLLLPYRLITGQDLAGNTAEAIFWLFGFAVTLVWLRRFFRDHAESLGGLGQAVAVVLAAFLPATTFLLVRSMFYELPLMAGYAFTSAFFAALYEAIQGRRVLPMLVAASLSAGLAVGCHPNLGILLLPLAWIAATSRLRRSLLAAILPAAIVGAGLAWYNWARFGSVTQFGFDYGQNGFFSRHVSVFTPDFIGTNLRWYFVTPPSFAPYFPFVYPGNNTFRPAGYEGAEEMVGILPTTLLVLWTMIGLGLSRVAWRTKLPGRAFLGALIVATVVAILFVCSLQIRANRYMVDFTTPLTWLVIVAGLTAATGIARAPLRRMWLAGFVVLTLGAAFSDFFGSVQQFNTYQNTHPKRSAALARSLNLPYRWFYALGAQPSGLITLKFRLSPPDHAIQGPLYTTGTPGHSDTLFVANYPGGTIKLGFDHFLYGGPVSQPIAFDYTKEHTVKANFGSSYPPITDSTLRSLPAKEGAMLKRFAYIELDGKVVLRAYTSFFESPPWAHEVGSNPITFTGWNSLTGSATSTGVLGPREANLLAKSGIDHEGIFLFVVDLHPVPASVGLPILAEGDAGSGHLLFARGVSPDKIQFGIDDWGHSLTTSSPFALPPASSHVMVVWGPTFVHSELARSVLSDGEMKLLNHRILVFVEGQLTATFLLRLDPNERLDHILVANNPQGFSTALAEFPALTPDEQPMAAEDFAPYLSKFKASLK